MGGWAKLSRLVIALAVAAVAAVGTASGSAHAQQVPQPGGCEGWVTVYWPVVLDGTPFELSSYGTCGLHSFTFEGRAAPGASANLCSLEQSSLSFAGTEQVDDGPVLSSTWAITGANGIFAITTTSADGTQRAGAFDATLCDPGIA